MGVALAACVALLLAGSAAAAAPPSAAGPAPHRAGLKPVDQNALERAVRAAAEQMLVPGAMVLVRTPEGTYRAAAGTTELGAQLPPTADTHFRIASNTKTMTAALITLLAQDGGLSFGDPVSAYVDGVPNGANITIADLLKMRSGLYGYTNAPELATAMDADLGRVWTPQEMLDIAFKRPPNFAPNTGYEYSNTNYALLGLVAEKVGGKPLAEQFQQRLLGPLGLRQTSLPAATDDKIPAPYSHGYMYGGTAYALVDEPYPAEMQAAARAGTLKPIDYTNQNPSYATAAGGAVSTADDLAVWISSLVTGKVFDAAFRRQWLDSLQAEDPAHPDGQKYGYGISYQRFAPNAAMYYHGGELPGFNSFMGHDPDNGVTIVIWTNLPVAPDGRTTANALLPTVLDQVYGLSLAPAPTPTS
ncbi:D-Ala-D-Ala carboxypeptidase [Catellatospora sp. TT07R-123]|uniref:serine hydrolase domain-containing protein n=1 Tax=Catellatospora sp. TT07R-123 TaxID=2733863 RepID=UPI001B2462E1|nr:serine hydrolase domain-containing protein [Catellatospora sp. TT07R-123]GHJ43072.1 D-Ala-D-Ala carboxypeptidase [Catellatospora sp. TT07R-123]